MTITITSFWGFVIMIDVVLLLAMLTVALVVYFEYYSRR